MHVLFDLTTKTIAEYLQAYVVSISAENHNLYPMNLPCQHVMKVSPIITVHYRNSICTITAVQTTLTYVIETTYSRGYRKMRGYEQRSPYPAPTHILPI
jgi:hypothetical protein